MKRTRSAWVALLMAVGLSASATWVAKGEESVVTVTNTDEALQSAFQNALKSVNELRKKNRSTVLDCTPVFAEFNRYKQIDPYISFFQSIEIPSSMDDRNQRHYVGFEINHRKLWSMGYKDMLRNDRLVIVFTTASPSSRDITSFKVTVLNSDHL